MYVARSRQKPPENAFQMRSRMKAEAEASEASKRLPEPAQVADQMPDLDALREAAARAAALVHGAEVEQSEPAELATEDGPDSEESAEPEDRRGRPASSAVAERTARVLELITEAGSEGISKPALAEAVGTKEANVYTSLRKLQTDGKVETRQLPDKTYRWFRS